MHKNIPYCFLFLICIITSCQFVELTPEEKAARYDEAMSYFYEGNGTPKNEKEALKRLRLLEKQGCLEAGCKLAELFFQNHLLSYLEIDYEKFKEYADQGEPLAMYGRKLTGGLLDINDSEIGDENDYAQKTFRALMKIAKDNEPNIKPSVPKSYLYDIWKAIGDCYEYGEGVEKNNSLAFQWHLKAAEHGNMHAQYSLAHFYEWKNEDEKTKRIVEWSSMAAEKGDPMAQCDWGYFHVTGYGGVPKDSSEAVKWYIKAAEQDYSTALYRLGRCYDKGRGVEQNYYLAYKCFRKAAEYNNPSALYFIGEYYRLGIWVKKDMYNAKKWYMKAAHEDLDDAYVKLNKYFKGWKNDKNWKPRAKLCGTLSSLGEY